MPPLSIDTDETGSLVKVTKDRLSYCWDGEAMCDTFVALADSTTDTTFLLAVLGKIAKAIGKHYEKSQNETLQALTPNYNNMKEEARYLSKLVEKNLQEYGKEIINSTAILMDDLCTGVCSVVWGLLGTPVCGAVCTTICVGNPVCISACAVACAVEWAAGCSVGCATVCGQNINPCDVGCSAFCTALTAALCVQFGPCYGACALPMEVCFSPFCEATVALWC